MSKSSDSGIVLTLTDIDNAAVRIADMWVRYNVQSTQALLLNEEARSYVLATDINTTSARILPHKNRTHQPKLTEISDNLQSQYWEATLGSQEWFEFLGIQDPDRERSMLIEAWIRSKLEAKKFRQTIGRQLLADYVFYGNAFAHVDYGIEVDDRGQLIYRGPIITRISPMDIVFNPQAVSFLKSPKITRQFIHVAVLASWPEMFPTSNFNKTLIDKAIVTRGGDTLNDWVEVIKERGITFDGFNTYDEYFKSDYVEVLIYRGDTYNPETGESKLNRVVYVIDRTLVIRDEPSTAPSGFTGLHHAGWRIRPDNLWAQGPLDNLVGMQYRIDHLENLKADVFDIIAHPVLLVKGEGVQEPEDGYAPGAVYYMGVDEQVEVLVPDATALNADNQIAQYHAHMENFAGAPPQSRGVRTPGEKTAFEVSTLESNSSKLFLDKARQFEMLLEGILQETYLLMMKNFDSVDFLETFDDLEGQDALREVSEKEIQAIGVFKAVGAKHWSRRNRETVEMREFQLGPLQDPKLRAHISGFKMAKFYEKKLRLEEDEIIEEFVGVKEDVHAQLTARAESERLSQDVGLTSPEAAQAQGQQQAKPGEQSLSPPQAVQSAGEQDIFAGLTS